MSDSRTRTVLSICDQWLAASETERPAVLQELCGADTNLQQQVKSVLDAMTQAGDVIDAQLADPESDWSGRQLGDYTLQERLGAGGMGAVYRATRSHDDFTQTVAIKVIRGRFMAEDLVRRFHAEREILASLNHPYIAQLIDGGSVNGVPFLVMEFIEGIPVDDYLDQQQASVADRIALIRKVAMAVQSAHQNLVVHRDLKPSNVLVTPDGIPKLLDFGIAKMIDDDGDGSADLTQIGRQAMTPNYASPEQILHNRVTTLSDVYSLGVLAYELLAGERPYQLDTRSVAAMAASLTALDTPRASRRLAMMSDATLRDAVAAARASTPERLARTLQGDLDNILAKALESEPDARYLSVSAFSLDLQRYLDGDPVMARADTWTYRLQRFVARNKLAVVFSVALLASLVAGLVASSWSYMRAEAARSEAAARFDQVRTLARTMMFDVYDDVARIPGTSTIRADLATTAQDYLQNLAASSNAPFAVQMDAAEGYSRLYTILNREAVADAEDRDKAEAAFVAAKALFESLTANHGQDATVWQRLI